MSVVSKPKAPRSTTAAKKFTGTSSLGTVADDASTDAATSGMVALGSAGSIAPDADSAEALAAGFADRVVHWARASDAPIATLDALRTAARMTSLATSAGHVCIQIDDVCMQIQISMCIQVSMCM